MRAEVLFTAVTPVPRAVPGTEKVLNTYLLVVVVLRLFPGAGEDNRLCHVLLQRTLPSSWVVKLWRWQQRLSLDIVCLPGWVILHGCCCSTGPISNPAMDSVYHYIT